jgi:hypothetical protein
LHLIALHFFLGLVLFFLLEVFFGGLISMLFEISFCFKIENLSVNFVRLGEESLKFFEALERLLFLVTVEIQPSLVLRFSFAGMLLILAFLLPGSDLRANILCIVASQNLVHLKLIFVPHSLLSSYTFFCRLIFALRATLTEHVNLEFIGRLFLLNHPEEEGRVVAVELPVVRLVVNLLSRLPWLLLPAVEVAALSISVTTLTVAVIVIGLIKSTLWLIIVISIIIAISRTSVVSVISSVPIVSVITPITSISSTLALVSIIIAAISIVTGLVRVSFALFCVLRFLLLLLGHLGCRLRGLSELKVVVLVIVILDLIPSYGGDSRYVFLLLCHFLLINYMVFI